MPSTHWAGRPRTVRRRRATFVSRYHTLHRGRFVAVDCTDITTRRRHAVDCTDLTTRRHASSPWTVPTSPRGGTPWTVPTSPRGTPWTVPTSPRGDVLRRRGLYRHHHAARRRPAAAGQEPGRPRAHRGHGYHVVTTAVCSWRRLLAHSGSSCPRLTDLKPVRSTCAKLQFANSSVNGRIVIIHLLMTRPSTKRPRFGAANQYEV